MNIFSPFEQFKVFSYLEVEHIIVNDIFIFTFIIILFIFFIFVSVFFGNNIFKFNNIENLLFDIYKFSYEFSITQLNKKGMEYMAFFQFLFIFLASANLLSMIPNSTTLSSYFNLIISLSFSIFLYIQLFGSLKHGILIFNLFLPNGTPIALSSFILSIEFISYMFRPISLTIRIVANIFSGHILISILSTFVVVIFLSGGLLFFSFLIVLTLLIIIILLELFIAVLQGYVFSVLSTTYKKDILYFDEH